MANVIQSEDRLDDLLSEPTPGVIETLGRLRGDIILLGVAGKMGPTLARMARLASDAGGVQRRIIGVARFSNGGQDILEAQGIETIRCDLLEEEQVAKLPEAANMIFMAGMKFGASFNPTTTWAMNSYLPGIVCRKFRKSRIIAFSTGNVYELTPVKAGGSREEDPLQPVGEYAMSCLGRERVFEYFSRVLEIPMALIRLNYACELRYGVLVDLARRMWNGETIDLSMGYFNTIWQGDANAMTLRIFDHIAESRPSPSPLPPIRRGEGKGEGGMPPWVVNVTGPETLSVRQVCEQFGRLMNRPVRFIGTEADTALLSNAKRGLELLGPPRVTAEQLIAWVADWVSRGGRNLNKPTHFESRDGKF